MIETILTKIGALLLTPVVFLSTFFVQPQQAPVIEDEALGVALPSGTALFETSLASPITGSASSLTLVANSIRGGGSLSGYQCFTIDEGSAQAEYVCGTVSGTSVTSLERGLSPSDGITPTTALQFSHRRGASVKITDFPLIQRLRSQAVGSGTYETPLQYATTVATSTVGSNSQNLASVAYVNSLSFGGVAASAQEAVNGFVELATGAEAASSTATGTTNARLALSTLISTSSAPTSGNVVVVTQDDGNIDSGFLAVGAGGSTTVRTYTSTTTTHTWAKPSNVIAIHVQLWGAGGGGGRGDVAGEEAGGGGGGGYFDRWFAASQLVSSSYEIVVGTGGAALAAQGDGNAGTASSFGTLAYAYGGGGGARNGAGACGGGGGGAYATGTSEGTGTCATYPVDTLASVSFASAVQPATAFSGAAGGGCTDASCAIGGNAVWGGAGGGSAYASASTTGGVSKYGGSGGYGAPNAGTGQSGTAPGGGGGGAFGVMSGAGAPGQVIITEYF